jgi:hypothetical protein
MNALLALGYNEREALSAMKAWRRRFGCRRHPPALKLLSKSS